MSTGTTGPTKLVAVRVTIPRVHEVDLQSNTFVAELKLEARWDDEDLRELEKILKSQEPPREWKVIETWFVEPKGSPDQFRDYFQLVPPPDLILDEGQRKKIESQRYFAPRLMLTNMVKETKMRQFYIIKENADGPPSVRFNWFVTGTFQHTFELKDFPFDEQDLTIELKTRYSCTNERTPVKLIKLEDAKVTSTLVTKNFAQKEEYILYPGINFETGVSDADESSERKVFSLLKMKLRVKRMYFYWISNVILPMGIVTSTLFSTYALPPEETNDRLSASLTILLAMVAFKNFTAEKLPKIAYLSLLDWYILLSFVLAFFVVFSHILIRACGWSEPLLTWTVNRTSGDAASGWVRIDPDSYENGAAAHNDARFGSLLPAVAYAQLNLLIVFGLALWFLVHLAAGCYVKFLYYKRAKKDPYVARAISFIAYASLSSCSFESRSQQFLVQSRYGFVAGSTDKEATWRRGEGVGRRDQEALLRRRLRSLLAEGGRRELPADEQTIFPPEAVRSDHFR